MVTSELTTLLLCILPYILQIYGETCHRFQPKRGVDIDPAMCEYHNFTREQESFLCHEACLNMDQVITFNAYARNTTNISNLTFVLHWYETTNGNLTPISNIYLQLQL